MKTIVMVPTYNESENISALIDEILGLKIAGLEIVVVDDNSPDGTAGLVEAISRTNKKVHLLLREGERGRGLAGRDGFLYCLKNNADIIIEMDGDFSHHPKYIPQMLKEIKHHDMVLGSRMVRGGRDIGRGAIRRFITKGANFYITLMLGIPVKDCNSGYRCYTRKLMKFIHPQTLESKGPAIVQEVLFRAYRLKARIKEIPIDFVNRTKGRSKLGLRELGMGYYMVLKLKAKDMIGRL